MEFCHLGRNKWRSDFANGIGQRGLRATDVPGGERLIPTLGTVTRMLLTFLVMCLAWVFFERRLDQAILILTSIGGDVLSLGAWASLTGAPSLLRVLDLSLVW